MNPKILKSLHQAAAPNAYAAITITRKSAHCNGLTVACTNALADGIDSVTLSDTVLPEKEGMTLHADLITDASGLPVKTFRPLEPETEPRKGMVNPKHMPETAPVVVVDAAKFFAAAYVAATHAASGDVRHYLNGICLDWADRNKLYVVGTDGHRLAVTGFDAAHHPVAAEGEPMAPAYHHVIITHRVLAVFADAYARSFAAMPNHTFSLTVTNHYHGATPGKVLAEKGEAGSLPVTQIVRLLAVSPDLTVHTLAELAREPFAEGTYPDWRAVDITRQSPMFVTLQHRDARTLDHLHGLADTPALPATKRPAFKAGGKYIAKPLGKTLWRQLTLTNSPDSAIDCFKAADPDAKDGTYTYANTPAGWYAQYVEHVGNVPKPAMLPAAYAPALAAGYLDGFTPSPDSEVTLSVNRVYLGMALHALQVAAVELPDGAPSGANHTPHTYKSIRTRPVPIDINMRVTNLLDATPTRHSHYPNTALVITSPDAPHTHIVVMPMTK